MRTLILAAGLVGSLAVVAGSGPAGAQPTYDHHHHHHYYHHYSREGCVAANRRSGRIGAVSGAVGGAIIGGAISHNAGGALLGAGAGALTGNAIGRNSRHC